jgi:hypothetical protein
MPKPSRLELQEKRGLLAGLKLIDQVKPGVSQSSDTPGSQSKKVMLLRVVAGYLQQGINLNATSKALLEQQQKNERLLEILSAQAKAQTDLASTIKHSLLDSAGQPRSRHP